MITPLTLSQSIPGYTLSIEARRLSKNTITRNLIVIRKLVQYFNPADPVLNEITPQQIQQFLIAQSHLKKSSLLTYHGSLASLWTWAVAEKIAAEHIIHQVTRPKPGKAVITPYTEDEVRRMITNLSHSKKYARPGKVRSRHSLPNELRNRAIILLLLDTGIRATELCELTVPAIDLKQHKVNVISGKGDKDRTLPISARTGQAIWKYLATRDKTRPNAPAFVSKHNKALDRHTLRRTLRRIGNRAGVQGVGVHRFRHTFAIMFIRNGIDSGTFNPWALQEMLGHETMEMVRTYMRIAQADISAAHEPNSPVENLRL